MLRYKSDVPLTALAWAPDGKSLYVGRSDGCFLKWNPEDGSAGPAIPARAGGIRDLAVSPDGKTIAIAGKDRQVGLWKAESELRHLKGHQDGVFKVSFHPDGRRLATASADSTIRIWTLE